MTDHILTPMTLKSYDRDGQPLPDDYLFGDERRRPNWATDQRVGRTTIGDITVSTVYLMGIDHNFGAGPPILFETMIFAPDDDGGDHDLRRYATEEQAMRGHLAALDNLRAGRPPFDPEE